jgi:hypothetical protein
MDTCIHVLIVSQPPQMPFGYPSGSMAECSVLLGNSYRMVVCAPQAAHG